MELIASAQLAIALPVYTTTEMYIDQQATTGHNRLLTFKEIDKYMKVEGILLGIGLLALFILGIVVVVYILFKTGKGDSREEKAHALLSLIFPGLIKKRTHLTPNPSILKEQNTSQNTDAVVIVMEDASICNKEVRLFGEDKLIDFSQDCMPSRCRGICYCINCLHFWTYFYFFTIAFLAGIWFIVMICENSIYRKTGTCNDINVMDNSFTCFDLDNKSYIIDCEVGKSPNITVFCYLYNPNPGAAGIAYGFVKLILVGVVIYFRVMNSLRRFKNCQWILLIAQGIFTISTPILLLIILPSVHFRSKMELYFFHGHAVLRMAMFILVVVTPAAVIPAPGVA